MPMTSFLSMADQPPPCSRRTGNLSSRHSSGRIKSASPATPGKLEEVNVSFFSMVSVIPAVLSVVSETVTYDVRIGNKRFVISEHRVFFFPF